MVTSFAERVASKLTKLPLGISDENPEATPVGKRRMHLYFCTWISQTRRLKEIR